jgi:hypothetical protein
MIDNLIRSAAYVAGGAIVAGVAAPVALIALGFSTGGVVAGMFRLRTLP